MKKYTVIYGEFFGRGEIKGSVTKFEYIECFDNELQNLVEEQFGWGNVWFIFQGHCN